MLAPEFAGAFPEELVELELGQCFVRINTDWVAIRTLPPTVPPWEDPTERIVAGSRVPLDGINCGAQPEPTTIAIEQK